MGAKRRAFAQLSMGQKGIVTVYSKSTCPHCVAAKELLTSKYDLEVVEIDVLGPETDAVLQQMRTFSGGRNTVPQVFFNSKHLGGNDDVQSLDTCGALEAEVEIVKNTPAMMMPNWFHPWY
jgi:glutaredoxin 3